MKAFFIAHVNITDPEKFQQYAKAAGKSMQPYNGQVVTKGKLVKQLAGEQVYENVSIVSFPDQESLDNWFHSDAYQALIPLRDKAADILLNSFNAAN
jgi:uncharacterized protein (DUF1330 family)